MHAKFRCIRCCRGTAYSRSLPSHPPLFRVIFPLRVRSWNTPWQAVRSLSNHLAGVTDHDYLVLGCLSLLLSVSAQPPGPGSIVPIHALIEPFEHTSTLCRAPILQVLLRIKASEKVESNSSYLLPTRTYYLGMLRDKAIRGSC